MICSALMMLFANAFITLRLGDGPGGSFPRPLKAEEERECVERWVGQGDIDARNTLVEHNLRLVAHIVKKYYAQSSEQEDLISIGTIGLIKGVSTYRPDKNVRLATYCSRCIENEILMHFRRVKKTAGELSLSDSIESDGDGGGLSIMDVLAQEDDMFEKLSASEMRSSVRYYASKVLDDREERIITVRYGLSGGRGLTQRETAELLGISRSYVSRIEKKALEKLRAALED